MINTSISKNSHFELLKNGKFKEEYSNPFLSKEQIKCHICGETNSTLYKIENGENKRIYICKECKILEALNEED